MESCILSDDLDLKRRKLLLAVYIGGREGIHENF